MSFALRQTELASSTCDPLQLSASLSAFFTCPIVAVSGPILDVVSPFANERSCVQHAVSKRRKEFFSGRYYARQALHFCDAPMIAIGRGAKGEPLWPQGILGSLSHSDDYVMAAVTRSTILSGFGLDFHSHQQHVEPSLTSLLCNEGECELLADLVDAPLALTALFSVKEAAAKAISPHIDEYLEFRRVHLHRAEQHLIATIDGYDARLRCLIQNTTRGVVSAAAF